MEGFDEDLVERDRRTAYDTFPRNVDPCRLPVVESGGDCILLNALVKIELQKGFFIERNIGADLMRPAACRLEVWIWSVAAAVMYIAEDVRRSGR